jgi:hypothetical protein
MWHYALNYRKRKKTKITPLIATKEDEHSDESSS